MAGELVDVRMLGQAAGVTVTASLPRRPAHGELLSMFVRPSAVRIVAPEEAQFMAQVRDVAFCGRGYEHALAGDGPLLFTRVFSEKRWERGSAVGVRLSPEGCLVLRQPGRYRATDGADEASGSLVAEDVAHSAGRRRPGACTPVAP